MDTIKNKLNTIPDWKEMAHTIGYKGIVQNIPYILFCTCLGLVFITLNHYAENTIRKLNQKSTELKEIRWQYIDQKSQLMFLTKESEIIKKASLQGLEVLTQQPIKIEQTP